MSNVIFTYTRAQANTDGVLIDVSETAHEAGFSISVALTATLWSDIAAIPERLRNSQDRAGRLWDVLWMAVCAARGALKIWEWTPPDGVII